MSEIVAESPGWLTTVQDLGREGFAAQGVSPSGAADGVALRVGNRLVGNAEGAAGLEMTLLGGEFRFGRDAVVALGGADFGATLDGAAVKMWRSTEVRAGQTLRLGATLSGARGYLCVRGGIAVEAFLGSASTHLLSGLGGYEGRALRRGDAIAIGTAAAASPRARVADEALRRLAPRKTLRVTEGPQAEWFSREATAAFYAATYRVAENSNRMGVRLEGASVVAASAGGEMITEGVSLGAVQVPPDGQPIIVFVEQQTTGGYAKIANVIAADLGSVGQLRPRDEMRFERVTLDAARALFEEQETLIASEELFAE